eukprot:g8146.t1 g8146   contig27:290239-290619(-)
MSSMKEIVSHDPNGSGGTVQKASMMCFSSSQQQAHQGLYHLPPLVGTRKNPSSSNASPTITPIRRVCNKKDVPTAWSKEDPASLTVQNDARATSQAVPRKSRCKDDAVLTVLRGNDASLTGVSRWR